MQYVEFIALLPNKRIPVFTAPPCGVPENAHGFRS